MVQDKSKTKKTEPVKNSIPGNRADEKQRFIELYPEYGTVGATMKAISRCRRVFYDWTAADPEFKAIYETQLLPDRRDEIVSIIYRIATGKEKATQQQLAAAFGFAQATNHIRDEMDNLIFNNQRVQMEMTGKDGGPVLIKETEVRLSGFASTSTG